MVACFHSNAGLANLFVESGADVEARRKVSPDTKWRVGWGLECVCVCVCVCVVIGFGFTFGFTFGFGFGLGDVLTRTSSQTHILHNPIQS